MRKDIDNKMQQDIENENASGRNRNGAALMYLVLVGMFFVLLTVVFVFFPRSEYSELEKRDLAEFPQPEKYTGNPGAFTAAVSTWFSDTEPYRDDFMTLSMAIRNAMKGDFRPDEETISFRPADVADATDSKKENAKETTVNADKDDISDQHSDNQESEGQATDTPEEEDDIEDGKAKLGSSGTIIIGKGDKVRALMAFGGTPKGGGGYVDLLNTLAESFPTKNVYAMVAPLATEYYLPAKAAKASNPQKPFIYSVRDRLSPKVKFVDIYDELLKHKKEDIYLRTDHHWSGLGGYYAAKRLAETAGVPFKDLNAYDRHEVKNFVGSMYGYSKDISVKNAPEVFVYYVPNGVTYDTEFVTYSLNKNFKIIRESKPFKSQFFKKIKDGSGNAYLTFMGTDQAYVKVKTSTPGNRKILIIKDSYGNAVPGNLFYSFNEVHVIDFRYFTHNLKEYVDKNGITDIAVCFNVFNAYSSGSAAKVKKMLTQTGGIQAQPSSETASKTKDKGVKATAPKTADAPSPEAITEESTSSTMTPEMPDSINN